jgi:hypothetical protein
VVGVLLALGLVGVFVSALGDPRPEPRPAQPPQPPAGDQFPHAGLDVIALLDGLRAGDDLAGCTVLTIASPKEGQVAVDMQKADGLFAVSVAAKKAERDRLPPVETAQYNVFIGHVRGTTPPSRDVMSKAAEALAERIRRREGQVPRPAGM